MFCLILSDKIKLLINRSQSLGFGQSIVSVFPFSTITDLKSVISVLCNVSSNHLQVSTITTLTNDQQLLYLNFNQLNNNQHQILDDDSIQVSSLPMIDNQVIVVFVDVKGTTHQYKLIEYCCN